MPLWEENGFIPVLSDIPKGVAQKAKLMFLNYPNNPTAAVCDERFFKEAIAFAHKHNSIICHDAAYTEIAYDGYKPLSFLEVDGAREVGIEFHSLSKTCNMTGWRIGFACGNEKIVAGLARVKSNIDSGIFTAIQRAGIAALKNAEGMR